MEIRLSPELEAMVKEEVASGRFASVDEFFAEAVEQFHEREQWRNVSPQEEQQRLDLSLAQASRGELFSEAEAREKMRVMKLEWAARQQSS